MADAVGVTLFPPRCAACAAALAARPRFALCDPCFEVLEPNGGGRCGRCDVPLGRAAPGGRCPRCAAEPPGFDGLRAPWVYGGPLAELIGAAKFTRREDVCAAVARLLSEDPEARALAAGSTLVPVPLGPARARQRGYNPSAAMARLLGRAWGLRVAHALQRRRDTEPQSRLEHAARRANVAGAFVAPRALRGRFTVVDDVVTSGETAGQAAAALKIAGADAVVVVAAARAVLEPGGKSSHITLPLAP